MAGLSTLTDDFDDNTINASKWNGNYGTVSETGGRARINCDTSYNAYASANSWTFDSFFARVYPAAQSGATTEAYLVALLYSAGQPAGTNTGFVIDAVSGTIGCINWVGFSDGGAVYTAYNSTTHAWLRLAASGGNLLWQTAPDGVTWTTRRSIATPAWLAAAADVSVTFESHRSDGSTNFAEVDSFNVVPFSTVNATGDASLGALTAAASGVRTVPATSAVSLGALTAAGTAVRTIVASAAPTFGALSAAAVGVRTVSGSTATGLGGLTAAGTGVRVVAASAVAALGAPVAAGTGVVSGIVAAVGSADLGGLTAQATAVSSVTHRPDLGTTSRSGSGTTTRPFAGVTARP